MRHPAPPSNPTKKHNSLPHPVRLPPTTLPPGRRHGSTRGPHAAGPRASSCCLWTGGERPRRFLTFPPLTSAVCASETHNETGSHWKRANATAMRQCPCFVCFLITMCTRPWRPLLINSGGALTVQLTDSTDAPHTAVSTGAVHFPSSGLCHDPFASNHAAASHTPSDCHRQRGRRVFHTGPHAGHTPTTHHASSCCLWTGGKRARRFLAFSRLKSSVCASETQNETRSHRKRANATATRQCPCFVCFSITTAHEGHWSACGTTSPHYVDTPVASSSHQQGRCAHRKAQRPYRTFLITFMCFLHRCRSWKLGTSVG